MGVNRDDRLLEGDIEQHVGSLAPYSRQAHKLLAAGGHLAVKTLEQHLAKPEYGACLVAEKPYAATELLQAGLAQLQVVLRTAALLPKLGGDLVDRHIGGLSGEDHRNQQVQIAPVV